MLVLSSELQKNILEAFMRSWSDLVAIYNNHLFAAVQQKECKQHTEVENRPFAFRLIPDVNLVGVFKRLPHLFTDTDANRITLVIIPWRPMHAMPLLFEFSYVILYFFLRFGVYIPHGADNSDVFNKNPPIRIHDSSRNKKDCGYDNMFSKETKILSAGNFFVSANGEGSERNFGPVMTGLLFWWSILKIVRTHFAACGGEGLAKNSESKS